MIEVRQSKILVIEGKLVKGTRVTISTRTDYSEAKKASISISFDSETQGWSEVNFKVLYFESIKGQITVPLERLMDCLYAGPNINEIVLESLLEEKMIQLRVDLFRKECWLTFEGILEKQLAEFDEDVMRHFEIRRPQ